VCSYAGGCQLADDLCRTTCPPRIALAPDHTAWCWRPNDAWTPSRPAPERTGPADEIVVSVRGVSKTFRTPGRDRLSAVKDVSFEVRAGETLGVVGESGSGKTTLARLLLGLITPDEGEISVLGETWSGRPESQRRALRGRVQLVHQDPLAALDPRLTVERLVGEAFGAPGKRAARRHRDRIAELLGVVGLSPVVLGRLPRQLSGGQRQRVAIARALATDPSVIVCDEPVSALDISIQAQVLDLFTDLRDRLGVALVFISHDFGVINHISDRVLVLQDGSVVESGPVGEVLGAPRHPYTRRLLDDVPSPADAASRHPLEPR
jgi:peptide/nickel transport system ATP-binding protein